LDEFNFGSYRSNTKNMECGTWILRSLFRLGSEKTVARELAKYKLDIVGVQKIRWDKGGTEPTKDCALFSRNGNEEHELGIRFFVKKENISADKRM
jgi:hypothetical protein